MKTLKNKVYKALIKNENDWKICEYYAYHKPSGVKYWIANGLIGFSQEGGTPVNMGFWNQVNLFYWLRNVQRNRVINSLNG